MPDDDKAMIRSVLDALRTAHHAKDADAIGAQFAPDAVIYDLAPPLGHGLDVEGLRTWLAGWRGPVDLEERDVEITVSGDLAVCHGYQKVAATMPDGEGAEWWQRLTVCLARKADGWKIIHEHASVPFYMDGGFGAAIDLQP